MIRGDATAGSDRPLWRPSQTTRTLAGAIVAAARMSGVGEGSSSAIDGEADGEREPGAVAPGENERKGQQRHGGRRGGARCP